jgi:hypothetical protein
MKKYLSSVILSALMIFYSSILAIDSHAAEVSIGASVWCAWWSPYWTKKSEIPSFPALKDYPTAAGGPLLSVKIGATWSVDAAYLYGKFENKRAGYIPTIIPLLLIPMVVSISQDRWTERHELDFKIAKSIHQYVNIFIGIKYSGYFADDQIKIIFFNMKSANDNNYAGPVLGVNLRIPLASTLTLRPAVSWVMQFGTCKPNTGLFYDLYNSISGISRTTVMYYGPDITLSLAYLIRQANITLALGGRFQYLMIKNIGSGGFPGDGSDDMFGGINVMAMYSFTLSSGSQEGQEKK